MTNERQTAALAAAQPSYIFRGHAARIHSVQLVRHNSRLLTGDADGWVVCWKLESKRPVAVWRAHDAAILGTAEWGLDKIVTHGRDNALRIWQLRTADESTLSASLPADGPDIHRPKPWLLHTLPVNTLNFCAFSMCHDIVSGHEDDEAHQLETASTSSLLVAVPARDDKKVEIYQFPDEKLKHVVPRVQTLDTGMVMAVKLAHHSSGCLLAIVGYEGGFTALHALSPSSENSAVPQLARLMYLSQPHSQPVLSLDASPDGAMYFTSSADAVIAAHRVPELILDVDDSPSQVVVDKSEGNIDEATVAETNTSTEKSPREISVDATPVLPSQVDSPNIVESFNNDSNSLTFSKQQVPSSTSTPSELSFTREATPNTKVTSSPNPSKPSGLSSLLSSTPSPVKAKPKPPSALNSVVQPPHKSIQTKHAGQQSLQVRSDGRLLVTAGWDSRVRIYSAKTLKELAVLKWHNEGVYATAFGEILDHASFTSLDPASEDGREVPQDQSVVPAKEHGAQQRVSGLTKLQQQREWQVQMKHWVVAGAKDGKVSLWEVY